MHTNLLDGVDSILVGLEKLNCDGELQQLLKYTRGTPDILERKAGSKGVLNKRRRQHAVAPDWREVLSFVTNPGSVGGALSASASANRISSCANMVATSQHTLGFGGLGSFLLLLFSLFGLLFGLALGLESLAEWDMGEHERSAVNHNEDNDTQRLS